MPTLESSDNSLPTPRTRPDVDGAADRRLRLYRSALIFLGIGVAASALAIQCAEYLSLGAYLDHIEGDIIIIAWRYVQGAPIYEMRDGAPHFATPYGPLAYLGEIPGLLLFGA